MRNFRNLSFRSSLPEALCKKGVLRNFTKLTGKHLCQRLFFNKAAGLRPATLLKKTLWHRCFPVNFVKFLRTTFLNEHLRWLLLKLDTLTGLKQQLKTEVAEALKKELKKKGRVTQFWSFSNMLRFIRSK